MILAVNEIMKSTLSYLAHMTVQVTNYRSLEVLLLYVGRLQDCLKSH